MSNAVFPTLAGLSWDVAKTPIWRTAIQSAVSGKELRASLMSYPLWKFSLSYEVLRADSASQELQTLLGFFLGRQGQFDSFLYTDPVDNSVTGQNFGTGDGTTTAFQLVRTYGAGGFTFTEPVQNVNGTPSIYVAGVLKTAGTDYTIGSTGIVTFTSAPANGAALTWTGNYYFRCRFLQDSADFNQFMYLLFDLQKLEFQSVKL